MGLPQTLANWWGKDRATELAERVAGRSRQQVWQRIQSRVGELSAAEARGYIRARAAYVVVEETDRLIQQEGARAARIRNRLIDLAGEMLIQSLLSSTHFARQNRPLRRSVA